MACSLLLLTLLAAPALTSASTYQFFDNSYISDGEYLDRSFVSEAECLQACEARSDCAAIYYYTPFSECRLIAADLVSLLYDRHGSMTPYEPTGRTCT